MKAILRGTEENAIATFNASHRSLKEAIKRALELEQALTEPRLRDLRRARQALDGSWAFLSHEPDISVDLAKKAAALADCLARETFFRDLPAIEQTTRDIEIEYERRYVLALDARFEAYKTGHEHLVKTSGWNQIDEGLQGRIAAPIRQGMARDGARLPIPQLRSEREACDSRVRAAVAEVRRIVEGDRLVSISLGSYFGGGIETEEQLEAALEGIREECARLIGAGRKVVAQ
jgi:hypothetical protein